MAEEPTLHSLDKRLTAHEQVCLERQGTIIQRLGRIEKIIIAVAGVLALAQFDLIKAAIAAIVRHS